MRPRAPSEPRRRRSDKLRCVTSAALLRGPPAPFSEPSRFPRLDQVRLDNRVANSAEITTALADTNTDWLYIREFPGDSDIARIHAAKKPLFMAGPLVAGQEADNWSKAARLGIQAVLTDYPLELSDHLRKK